MSEHVLTSEKSLSKTPHYSTGEEIANAVTHGVAALMSIAGLAILVFPIPKPNESCNVWTTQ